MINSQLVINRNWLSNNKIQLVLRHGTMISNRLGIKQKENKKLFLKSKLEKQLKINIR